MGRGGNGHQTVDDIKTVRENNSVCFLLLSSTRWGSPRISDLTCSVVHRANEDFKKCALLIPLENSENLKIDDIAEA